MEHKDGHWQRGEAGVKRRKRAESGQLKAHRQLRVLEAQNRHWILPRHLDLFHAREVRAARGLEEPRGAVRLNDKVEWNLAIAESVEKLPRGELTIHADFKVARADAAQVHSRVGVLAGQVKPRLGGGDQLATPALHFVGRKLESAPGGTRQQGGRCPGTHQPDEFTPVERLRPAVSGAVALAHSSFLRFRLLVRIVARRI
jgi:hypothetical protein